MDVIEVIRREAARRHDAAVGAGADPWRPLSVVEAAIAAHELDLAWIARGDPMLQGGKGLYDPQLGLIACADEGPPGERALLAGHELGHAVVHRPAELIVDRQIDPSRLADAAASGVEKVVDYGRRERREIQADLFAREIVLPRGRARRLFLDEGLGAADIAERSGLPYALVAQQLLDALLLPEPPADGDGANGPDPGLDPSQAAAAAHHGTPFQLQAGPGTGKTKTLIGRIERLGDAGTDPADVLVLTFSNKTAAELVDRLAARRPAAAGATWVGTFHGFGLDVLRRFHDREGLPDDPRLVDRADAIGLLEDLVPTLPLRHFRNLYDPTLDLGDILSAISRAKDEVVGPDEYRALARRMAEAAGDDDARIRAEKALEVAEVYRRYDGELRRAGLLDFGDLVMRPALLLERDPEVRAWLQARHRHILVDEYQDVNRASIRLLKALAGAGERLWVVGDSRQSIYRFRGASSGNMARFLEDFPAGRRDQLKVNYRSSAEIVGAFVHFAATMKASAGVLALDLTAHRGPSGVQPELRRVAHPDDEAAAVAAWINELAEAGVAFRDQAVLCRGNGRLADLAAQLEARDIPVLFLGNLFERPEARDLLAVLSLLVDPRASGLPRVAGLPRYAMRLDEVARLGEHAAGCAAPMAWLAGAASLAPAAAASLARLGGDLDGFGATSQPWPVLCRLLLDRSDVLRNLVTSAKAADRVKAVAVWQLLGFCRSLPDGPGLPIQRLLDRARRLVLLAEERDLRQMPAAAGTMDAVRLMTVHGSKGLEFEAVHVPGMTLTSFPGRNQTPRCPPPDGMIAGAEGLGGAEAVKAGHDEEEECLFFVAMSRARRHLTLYASSRQADGKARSPSPFLDVIAPVLRRDEAPALFRPSRPDPAGDRVAVDWQEAPVVHAEQLSLYAKCPRRYFYTHVLGVAGGRRSTAFVRMHDVVYDVVRWLRDDPGRWHLPPAEVEGQFDLVWAEKGPTDHGYAEDFRRAGLDLVRALMRSREGSPPAPSATVHLPAAGVRLLVRPDEVRQSGNRVVFRRVRTGRKSSDEEDDIIYSLYHLAARRQHGAGAEVEAIHLSDETVTRIDLTARKLENREKKMLELAAGIAAGDYPRRPNERVCPRCPHYFICGPAPAGRLAKPGG
ncbi:ATP-dependent helicase [Microvirga soli]|uniref:ATP-dependent helicase n=1 Tax=Microvirga soli TaxID=1854496 RepID=UPI00191FC518|nr:ATP-dependent helicase [Microvirga soli]